VHACIQNDFSGLGFEQVGIRADSGVATETFKYHGEGNSARTMEGSRRSVNPAKFWVAVAFFLSKWLIKYTGDKIRLNLLVKTQKLNGLLREF
jgi:hypothetical protein